MLGCGRFSCVSGGTIFSEGGFSLGGHKFFVFGVIFLDLAGNYFLSRGESIFCLGGKCFLLRGIFFDLGWTLVSI